MSTVHGLEADYLGMRLRSPLVASPSPATRTMDSLLRLEDAGVGAVVLPSLFEEEVEAEEMLLVERLEAGAGSSSEAVDYFPDVVLGNLGIDRHLRLVEQASSRLTIPVIASLNGYSAGGWVRYAAELVEAGAQAIELNMYDVATDPAKAASEIEGEYLALVAAVRRAVSVPVSVKLSPYFSAFANFASRVVETGADGLVLFNRFYQPDLDIETMQVVPRLDLSHAGEERLPLRWIALLRPHLPGTSLALTSGVRDGHTVVKALLAGADVAMAASEVLRRGPERAAQILAECSAWLVEHEYESVRQLRGALSAGNAEDPHAFERSQYYRVLDSWRTDPRAIG